MTSSTASAARPPNSTCQTLLPRVSVSSCTWACTPSWAKERPCVFCADNKADCTCKAEALKAKALVVNVSPSKTKLSSNVPSTASSYKRMFCTAPEATRPSRNVFTLPDTPLPLTLTAKGLRSCPANPPSKVIWKRARLALEAVL